MITLIAAVAHDRVIGSKNDMPWYLPADLKHFREQTTGKTVVMGKNTYDSIVNRLGKPLPNRTNIVITREPDFSADGVKVVHSIDEALSSAPDVMVIGGASIYEQTIDKADRLLITEVDASIPGDTYFPIIDKEKWHEISRDHNDPDDKNPYPYDFVTYERN